MVGHKEIKVVFAWIPRNLLMLTLLVVLGSFGAMLWVLSSGKQLHEFIMEQRAMDFTENRVHPLFIHMQSKIHKEDAKVKELSLSEVTQKVFYS